jgi:hypothetical protein
MRKKPTPEILAEFERVNRQSQARLVEFHTCQSDANRYIREALAAVQASHKLLGESIDLVGLWERVEPTL